MLGITDLKVGKTIQLDGQPYLIVWNQHSKQARGGGVMKTKLKNLLTGNALERTFQGAESIEPAEVFYRKSQYLYASGDDYEFMDQENFETFQFTADQLGEKAKLLVDGMDVDVQYFGDKPINLQLPPKMTLKVVQTDPGVKGDTATGGSKPATLETGYVIKQVPLFINEGDSIVINTDSGEYVERAK